MKMKKFIFFAMGFLLLVVVSAATWGSISGGDDAEVILNVPADNAVNANGIVNFSCSANITGGPGILNISLLNNITGTWQINQTIGVESQEVNPNQVAYYRMEELSGSVLDFTGDNNGLNNQSTRGATGIITNAFDFDTSTNVDLPRVINGLSAVSVNLWLKSDITSGFSHAAFGQDSTIRVGGFLSNGTLSSFLDVGGVRKEFGTTVLDTNFHMHTIVYDGTNVQYFIDSVQVEANLSASGSVDADIASLNIGSWSNLLFWDGIVDEVGIWNISLNPSEITLLYNSGAGRRSLNLTNITSATINFNKTIDDSVIWTCSAGDTDGVVGFAQENRTLFFTGTSQTFNANSFETKSESFEISTTGPITITSATLIYAGTSFTSTNQGGGTFSSTIDIPLGNKNNSVSWNLVHSTGSSSSPSETQNVAPIFLELCNATFGTPYLNFSFKNETLAQEDTNASIISNWNFWIGGGSNHKTSAITSSSETRNKTICFSPANQTINTNVSLTYTNSESEQRNFAFSPSLNQTNILEQVLFLLPTSEGIFVTLQLINVAEQVLSGVFINATTLLGGTNQIVGSGITSSAGTLTMFLSPNSLHNFFFQKSGFAGLAISFVPDQSAFTITLGSESSNVSEDFFRGINLTVKPIDPVLFNDTVYNFNFSLTSSFWELDSFGFELRNGTNDTLLASASASTSGGTVNIDFNTSGNKSIVMTYFWVLNGTQINNTRVWLVLDSGSTGFSIRNFFDDLSLYLNSGIFGLDDFGMSIIIFLSIFTFTGIVSFKFGVQSSAAISFLVLVLVAFFDVALNLTMLNPVGAIDNFPTIFMTLVTISLFIREGIR